MLTIHNYKKLELHNIGVGKWYVSDIHEQYREYAITLRSPDRENLVYLSRIVKVLPNGRKAYQYYDSRGNLTLQSVTLDYIKDQSNLLRSLKPFCL